MYGVSSRIKRRKFEAAVREKSFENLAVRVRLEKFYWACKYIIGIGYNYCKSLEQHFTADKQRSERFICRLLATVNVSGKADIFN
jgi:hypothetical protein